MNGEHVVGMIAAGFEAGYAQHAFVWRASHGIVDIGTLNGSSRALDVNEQGAVVGDFVRPAGGAGTFLWTEAGGMRDVTPRSFTFGATPAGIDADGRIALQDNEDENGTTRSPVLVPRRR